MKEFIKTVIAVIVVLGLAIAFSTAIVRFFYIEQCYEYQQGYNQAVQDIKKQRQYDSLGALYNEMWRDDMNYIGIWTPSKIELNRRKIDSIFNELCNLKAELK